MSNDKPPKLLEGNEFLQWKREVEMWKLATTVPAAKQAPRVILSIIDKKARDFSTRLDKTKLVAAAGDSDGLSYLLAELAKYFSKDRVQTVFIAIENLETFNRPKEMSILDFVKEFGRRVDAVTELISDEAAETQPYHDGVLAYKVLKQANLSDDQQILAVATVKDNLTYESMVCSLKRAFGDSVINGMCSSVGFANKHGESSTSELKIKVEPESTYYGRREDYSSSEEYDDDREIYYSKRHQGYGGNAYRRSGYQNSRGQNNSYHRKNETRRDFSSDWNRDHVKDLPKNGGDVQKNGVEKVMNNKDRYGNVMRCHKCQSKFHFAKDCPQKGSNIMLQTSFEKDHVAQDYESVMLISETRNKALIDTGATSTVCGKIWLDGFIDSLTEMQKKKVQFVSDSKNFRFGDGKVIQATQLAKLPITLCGKDFVL